MTEEQIIEVKAKANELLELCKKYNSSILCSLTLNTEDEDLSQCLVHGNQVHIIGDLVKHMAAHKALELIINDANEQFYLLGLEVKKALNSSAEVDIKEEFIPKRSK